MVLEEHTFAVQVYRYDSGEITLLGDSAIEPAKLVLSKVGDGPRVGMKCVNQASNTNT